MDDRTALLIHHLIDQATKGSFARLRLAAAEDDRAMDVPGRQVLDRTLTRILVFDPCGLLRS